MLEILFLILKIIGWLLLGIIGLLLVLILLVLFFPIPYHIWLNGDSRSTSDFSYWIKIFWIQVVPRKEKKKKKPKKSKKKQMEKQQAQQSEREVQSDTSNERSPQPSIPDPTLRDRDEHVDEHVPEQKASDKKNKSKRSSASKKKRDIRKTIGRIKGICAALTAPDNQRACKHVLGEIRRLLHFIGPRRIQSDADFSLGDPSYTGYATAVLSVCPFAYGKRTRITPDFVTEELYIKGRMDVRGHVCLIHVAAAGIRLLLDKDIRTIIKTFRR